jgi:hypothetical protein
MFVLVSVKNFALFCVRLSEILSRVIFGDESDEYIL